MIAVVGLFAGCTAIIDGAEEAPETVTSMAQGSQPPTVIDTDTSAGSLGRARGDGGAATAGAPSLGELGGVPSSASGGQRAEVEAAGAAGRADAVGGAASAAGGVPAASGEGGALPAAGGEPPTEVTAGTSGSPSAGGSGGGSGSGGSGALPVGDAAHGHQLVVLSNCYRCHGDNLAGRSFYRNITPDIETGIGSWTDKQIADAVRGAIGPTGELFCASMPLYSGFKDHDIADVIAYLRLIPAVTNNITSVCPGHNP